MILYALFKKVAEGILGSGNVRAQHPVMGAEDFAFYNELCASLAIIPARGKHISWVFS
ncbi:hypothetical protein HPP92_024110 [Vanilla planifolia]|uniref:Uncharacterized protein n=1 Tax=Vanilla planifolia TaxID=51239 RepID=A0A835UC98_VANPL|nr:hypothetical protein HPP92_024110 [Vanilla planifolia]